MHRGHQYLLGQLKAEAEARGLETMALTFREHPAAVLGRSVPPMLCMPEAKISLLSQWVKQAEMLDFTEDMSHLTASQFMAWLHEEYRIDFLLLGYDHHFGRPTAHDDYESDGARLGIEVARALPLEGISSSAVRRTLAEGDVEDACRMLGRPYTLTGTVVHGHHIGREIGFPTANLHTPLLIPRTGVYAAHVKETGCDAIVNIGQRPTLQNGSDISVEVHIPGYQGDLYGQSLQVEFLRRLRDEMHFPSIEALRAQIQRDIESL